MYMFTSSTKHEIRHLIIIFQVLGAVMAKKCTKMCNTCAKLLFCQSKPIAFMPFLLTSPLSLLKLPTVLWFMSSTRRPTTISVLSFTSCKGPVV